MPDTNTTIELTTSQRDCVEQSMFKFQRLTSIINRAKPGTGKTYTTLETLKRLLNRYYNCDGNNRILIVCPKSVVVQWKKSITTYLSEFEHLFDVKNFDAINKNTSEKLREKEYFCIVFDELHKYRNNKTGNWIYAVGLRSQYRIGLTGTTLINRPTDLHAIIQLMRMTKDVAYCSTQKEYDDFVCAWQQITPYRRKCIGFTDNKAILDKFLESFNAHCVTITTDITVPVKKFNIKLETVVPENITLLMANLAVAKVDWFLDFIKDYDYKVVVFSKYTSVLDALSCHLGNNYMMYTGELSQNERLQVISDFQGNEKKILLATISSMGEGVDGLQYCCHTCVFFDESFNPPETQQAIARLARKGQTETVKVYKLRGTDKVDTIYKQVSDSKLLAIETLEKDIEDNTYDR